MTSSGHASTNPVVSAEFWSRVDLLGPPSHWPQGNPENREAPHLSDQATGEGQQPKAGYRNMTHADRAAELADSIAALTASDRIAAWAPADRVHLAGTIANRDESKFEQLIWDDLHPWEKALLGTAWRLAQIGEDTVVLDETLRLMVGQVFVEFGARLMSTSSDERDQEAEARDAQVYELNEWADATDRVGF